MWEILQQAFHQQGPQSLDVVLHRSEAQSLDCFRKHGFYDARSKTPGDEPDGHIRLIWSHSTSVINAQRKESRSAAAEARSF